nr:hypothetical protein [Campylobacterota bacterium]
MNIKLKYLVISLVATTFIGCGSGGSGESSNDESTEPTSSIDSQNSTNSSSEESNQSISQTLSQFKLEAWADNWFAAYLGERLIIEDSVSITTEKSFNSETETFEGTYPLYLNFIIKDFKENDTGLEYIGQANQQIGDGGFIMQITDLGRGKVIAVSDEKMQCKVIHKAPLDKACANEANPIAGEGSCLYSSEDEPSDWKSSSFDYGSWTSAKVYSEDDVRPKDGYDNITWDADAKLIWSSDLELDNTLLCTLTVEEPKES